MCAKRKAERNIKNKYPHIHIFHMLALLDVHRNPSPESSAPSILASIWRTIIISCALFALGIAELQWAKWKEDGNADGLKPGQYVFTGVCKSFVVSPQNLLAGGCKVCKLKVYTFFFRNDKLFHKVLLIEVKFRVRPHGHYAPGSLAFTQPSRLDYKSSFHRVFVYIYINIHICTRFSSFYLCILFVFISRLCV